MDHIVFHLQRYYSELAIKGKVLILQHISIELLA
jgi:hypothetical protein